MSTTVSYPAANLTITYTFNDPRSLPEVVLHSALLRSAAIIARYYLSFLQGAPRLNQILIVFLFVLFPNFPLNDILFQLGLCLYIAATKPWSNSRSEYLIYLLSGVLGVQARADSPPSKEGIEDNDKSIKPKLSQNPMIYSLFRNEFSDFERQKCSCTSRLCRRFKTRSFLGTITLLSLILLYCTMTFLLYIRRCSHTYMEMAHDLLQGTPPGSKEADIYTNALETISGFDQLNAVWAIGGIAASAKALVLKVTGWEWRRMDPGPDPNREPYDPRASACAQFVLVFLLQIFLTRQSWSRAILSSWNSEYLVRSLGWTIAKLGIGFYAVYVTYCWTRGKVLWKKEPTAALVLVVWTFFMWQRPVTCTAMDLWELASCVKGGSCPYPLFLWKDAWSDFWWIY